MTEPDKSFEEKIIKEISNSGFPLEVFISIVLKKQGWTVRPSLDYYDKNIDDYRETDIIAYKPSSMKEIFNILVIECKKSAEKPWVFIQQKRFGNLSENLNIAAFRQDFIYYDNLETTMNFHHYSQKPICCHYFVPFTNEDQKNSKLSKAIFHAKNQVISALTLLIEKRVELQHRNQELKNKIFYYPIIVFDGALYSAIINEESIQLNEENQLLLSIERELSTRTDIGSSANSTRTQEYKPYMIDIVKKDFFEEYLHNFERYYNENPDAIRRGFKN
jgi:hypothetical protein